MKNNKNFMFNKLPMFQSKYSKEKWHIISWFTLIEILVWILIFSFIIITWFQVFFFMLSWKTNLSYKIELQKESLYFSEKFFEMIKKWWTVDYEEYFNRKVVWNTTYLSWHYDKQTWFWNFWNTWIPWSSNFWENFYYCKSPNWSSMWTSWCFTLWKPQRFLQYAEQFIDYNSDKNGDNWDQDWNWSPVWDEDDEYLWEWPVAFDSWTDVKEIYLIWWNGSQRTYFRWHVKSDPNRSSTTDCDFTTTNGKNPTWPWCLWNIEFLKLDWKDWWLDHNLASIDITQSDWKIDTWVVNSDFVPTTGFVIAWNWWLDQYWQPIFSDAINITDFKVFPYPNWDIKLAWKSKDNGLSVNPYLQISFKILPSWKKRKKIKWIVDPIDFTTTINLTDIFSK